jgi:hypothetical protein
MSGNAVIKIAVLLALSLLTSGAQGQSFAFPGRQVWPTAENAIADTDHAVPVYHNWPDRPYRVIGVVPSATNGNQSGQNSVADAAQAAKNKGGDAIIVRPAGKLEPRLKTSVANDSRVISPVPDSVLVIKWKSAGEIDAYRKTAEAFWAKFQTQHHGLEESAEFKKLAIEYSAHAGLNLNSKKDSARLEKDLDDLLRAPTNAGSTKWLFHGTFHADGVAASIDQTICGLAVVTQTKDGLAITANSDEADLSFNGLVQSSRLNGAINLSIGPVDCQARAQGVLLSNRISLDARGQDAQGTTRASFTFLR